MIFTSYFSRYRGNKGVSIARKTPNWIECETCKDLMPPWSLIEDFKEGRISWKEYRKSYIRQLRALDIDDMYQKLNGKVLLCWCTGKHCHRRIVREWFTRNGYSCEELEPSKENMTCAYCRNLSNHSNVEIFCKATGEMMNNSQQLSRSCEDWEGRYVTKRIR